MKKQVALYNRLISVFIFLLIVLITGITGYIAIEGWSVLDAFYMVVITLASVGFMEVHPLSPGGRIFTVLLILCGSGILIYAISVITAFVVEGELTDILRRRKMNREIEKLSNHFIVCGAGQTAKYVIDELYKTKRPFVVIEKDGARALELIEKDILCVEGCLSRCRPCRRRHREGKGLCHRPSLGRRESFCRDHRKETQSDTSRNL